MTRSLGRRVTVVLTKMPEGLMQETPFTVNAVVWPAYYALAPEEKEAVVSAVAPLARLPEEQWPAAGAMKLVMEEPEYMVRVNEIWRVFVRPRPSGRLEIVDLARKETLRLFANGKPDVGGAA